MRTTIVKCKVETTYFKRGKNAVESKTIRFLKTGSHLPSLDFVQQDLRDCPRSFFESIENWGECSDGYHDLLVIYYPGTYEYPNEGEVIYKLRVCEK